MSIKSNTKAETTLSYVNIGLPLCEPRSLNAFADEEAEAGEAEECEFPCVIEGRFGRLGNAALHGVGPIKEREPVSGISRGDIQEDSQDKEQLHWNNVLASLLTAAARVFCAALTVQADFIVASRSVPRTSNV